MKKQIMSIAAAAAILTTGAMAFDYTYDGEIVSKITAVNLDTGTTFTDFASYVGGVEANTTLELSTNNKGDALIYPAFQAGEVNGQKWNSTLVVRNTKNAATVCKVVLYAADNSRELLDFDIYLSPYDVFRFNIDDQGVLTTNDGSFARIDETFRTNKSEFFTHNGPVEIIGDINHAKDILTPDAPDVTAGYAIIYAMVQSDNIDPETGDIVKNSDGFGAYHGDHTKLLEDFRQVTDICRDYDNNISTTAEWRTVLSVNSGTIQNGTGVETNVTAPNVDSNCLQLAIDDRNSSTAFYDKNSTLKAVNSLESGFISPSSDLLFGDVTISSSNDAEDPRNLLLQATALANYTADNQMMLWVPGEYAAIQDRRITPSTQADPSLASGFATSFRFGFSDYNVTGIRADSATFVKERAYYTFDDHEGKGANTLLITQPTKRALIMANNKSATGGTGYWIKAQTGISPIADKWGEFTVSTQYFDENELLNQEETKLAIVLSPVSSDPEAAYKNELQPIADPEGSETAEGSLFRAHKLNGFAIMDLGKRDLGMPAIVSQMTGSLVGEESQINWIYSTTTTIED